MCYNVSSKLRTMIKYARHRGDNPNYIAALENKLEEWMRQRQLTYHMSGFAHQELMVFTNEKPDEPQGYSWGLIPGFMRDWDSAKKIRIKTLNARSETIFQLPSFKNAAVNRRCLIYVDGFFEHHHLGKLTYPFYITTKNDSPIALAGLWEEWADRDTGEVKYTATIVTTRANAIMAKIHNNPKAKEPRMPVILSKEKQNEWLAPCTSAGDQKHLLELCAPYPEDELNYYSVRRLRGKDSVGNVPQAIEKIDYPELALSFQLEI